MAVETHTGEYNMCIMMDCEQKIWESLCQECLFICLSIFVSMCPGLHLELKRMQFSCIVFAYIYIHPI